MVTKKLFKTINELQQVQQLAEKCPDPVAFHSPDSSIRIDAKSYIGMYALDFSQPILVVSENSHFHDEIQNIGETIK